MKNMFNINTRKIGLLTLLTLLIVPLVASLAYAQYQTTQTTDVTIPASGTFQAQVADAGVSYTVTGTVGATGTITTDTYNGNPQATATIPSDITLAHFIGVTINMNASQFVSATIVVTYTDADIAGLTAPFSIYKYDPTANSFTAITTTVDESAKTMTATLNSPTDPLLAIGGTSSGTTTTTDYTLFIVIGVVVVVLIVLFVVVWRYRKS
jgi:hypothetical protein